MAQHRVTAVMADAGLSDTGAGRDGAPGRESRGGAAALRLVPPSLRSAVEDQIRQAILSGALPPGTHLSDRMMCERFGVSRTIVREAVRLLEAEGLVSVLPRRGPFVAFLSAAEAVQIYEVRGALEALAGQGFAERASDEERAALRAVVAELEAAGPHAPRERLLDHKRRFYDILLRGCRNAHAARMLELLLNRNMQLRATSLSAPDRLPGTIRELRRVLEAIEQRDGEGAALACRDHVRAAAAVALRVLRERERTGGAAAAQDGPVPAATRAPPRRPPAPRRPPPRRPPRRRRVRRQAPPAGRPGGGAAGRVGPRRGARRERRRERPGERRRERRRGWCLGR